MAGLYIHIPFCEKKCGYCDFFSVRFRKDNSFIDNFLNCLSTELIEKSYLFSNQTVETIYFGGGTPSILPVSALSDIYKTIASHYNLADTVECTIEINPEHATDAYFSDMRASGFINRLSTGFQAMDDAGLKYLGRNHSVADNLRYLDLCEKYDFSNYSADYIFGYEILTEAEIERSFRILAGRGVPHISAYSLAIEENTPFMLKLRKGEIHKMDDEFFLNQFRQIHYLLQSLGYQHYEISNYAKPGMYSVHNSNYWDFVPYLGFGPSAHSYLNNQRGWNSRTIPKYTEQINSHTLFDESESLSPDDRYNEYIMLRFRTSKGVNIPYLRSNFSQYFDNFQKNLARRDFADYFEVNGDYVNLNLEGFYISDHIISEFFV